YYSDDIHDLPVITFEKDETITTERITDLINCLLYVKNYQEDFISLISQHIVEQKQRELTTSEQKLIENNIIQFLQDYEKDFISLISQHIVEQKQRELTTSEQKLIENTITQFLQAQNHQYQLFKNGTPVINGHNLTVGNICNLIEFFLMSGERFENNAAIFNRIKEYLTNNGKLIINAQEIQIIRMAIFRWAMQDQDICCGATFVAMLHAKTFTSYQLFCDGTKEILELFYDGTKEILDIKNKLTDKSCPSTVGDVFSELLLPHNEIMKTLLDKNHIRLIIEILLHHAKHTYQSLLERLYSILEVTADTITHKQQLEIEREIIRVYEEDIITIINTSLETKLHTYHSLLPAVYRQVSDRCKIRKLTTTHKEEIEKIVLVTISRDETYSKFHIRLIIEILLHREKHTYQSLLERLYSILEVTADTITHEQQLRIEREIIRAYKEDIITIINTSLETEPHSYHSLLPEVYRQVSGHCKIRELTIAHEMAITRIITDVLIEKKYAILIQEEKTLSLQTDSHGYLNWQLFPEQIAEKHPPLSAETWAEIIPQEPSPKGPMKVRNAVPYRSNTSLPRISE
ncbi:MAG: hypothetical protein OEY79_03495, partial [Anaplasmataceae bacterium]|nr:hypothetical protein [Anaplasmataceae bacterium]